MRKKKYSFLKLSVVFLLLFTFSSLQAQEKDFATWANVGFDYKVKPAFVISGAMEWRTKDNLSATDRIGMNIGGQYTLLPFLKVGAGYEVHYRNRGEDGWKFRHRYRLDGTLSTRVRQLKFSLRERFQHTFDENSDVFHLRSRAMVAYDLSNSKLEPYVSIEMYNGLNRGADFEIQRMRYRGGISFPLSSRWEADVFYLRQWEKSKQKNVIGVECTYSF